MGRLSRLLYRSSLHDVFERSGDLLFDSDKVDFDVQDISYLELDSMTTMPAWLEEKVFASSLVNPMKKRLESEGAKLFVLHKNTDLLASAWTQSMQAFRSRYGDEFAEATMLGPDWTHLEWRGKGMHPYLIRKRVEALGDQERLVAVVESGYKSSIAGFTKNGFSFKKRCRVTTIGSLWHQSRTIDL